MLPWVLELFQLATITNIVGANILGQVLEDHVNAFVGVILYAKEKNLPNYVPKWSPLGEKC